MTGGESLNRIAWDSCIFLAWLNNEEDKPLDAIERLLMASNQEKITLIFSTVIVAEVLDHHGDVNGETKFRQFIRRSKIIPANVDIAGVAFGMAWIAFLAFVS